MATATATVTDLRPWTPGDSNCIAPADDCLDVTHAAADIEDMKHRPEDQGLDLACCLTAPWYWLVNHCVTLDEHDAEHPYKRFPPLAYLRAVADDWWWTGIKRPGHKERPGLALPKSRKNLMTWLIALLFFGECQFCRGKLNLVQSYKLEEAEAVIAKMHGAWERQPPWIRQPCEWTTTEARFVHNDSRFKAVPHGPEQLQGPTLSGYLWDEVGDHEEAAETFEAALPAVGEGGRIVMVGRTPRSWWHDVFLADKIGE